MPRIDIGDFITDYERAMCYFTLPKISYIISPGIVFLYALFLILSFSILFIGIAYNSPLIANMGGLSAIIVAVIVALILITRAIINEYRWRRCLEEANNIPQQLASELPDPFQNNTLVCIPLEKRENALFPCVDRTGEILYFIDELIKNRKWVVKTPQDIEIARIEGKANLFSFVISYKLPLVLRIYENEKLSYIVEPKWSLFSVAFTVSDYKKTPTITYTISDSGIFLNKKLVGRFYQLRKCYYLDIQQEHFNLGFLALLIYLSK